MSFLASAVDQGEFGPEQRTAFEVLKEIFHVSEGEFFKHRPAELASLLNSQLESILADDIIEPSEDESQAALQDALDLGYDQYMALCRRSFENETLRLRGTLAHTKDPAARRDLQDKIDALAPLLRIAELQQRTLGALY